MYVRKEDNSIIKLQLAKKEIEIYPRPEPYKVTLNTLQFENPISSGVIFIIMTNIIYLILILIKKRKAKKLIKL